MVDLPGPPPVRPIAALRQPPADRAEQSRRQANGDLVEKSLPQLVRLAAELSSEPPPVDYAKIAQVRAAISTGGYRIDPDQIARALIGKAL
jgi:negative regulator of flagellin synthesis FlgM